MGTPCPLREAGIGAKRRPPLHALKLREARVLNTSTITTRARSEPLKPRNPPRQSSPSSTRNKTECPCRERARRDPAAASDEARHGTEGSKPHSTRAPCAARALPLAPRVQNQATQACDPSSRLPSSDRITPSHCTDSLSRRLPAHALPQLLDLRQVVPRVPVIHRNHLRNGVSSALGMHIPALPLFRRQALQQHRPTRVQRLQQVH